MLRLPLDARLMPLLALLATLARCCYCAFADDRCRAAFALLPEYAAHKMPLPLFTMAIFYARRRYYIAALLLLLFCHATIDAAA